jgi:hypothetical protein
MSAVVLTYMLDIHLLLGLQYELLGLSLVVAPAGQGRVINQSISCTSAGRKSGWEIFFLLLRRSENRSRSW